MASKKNYPYDSFNYMACSFSYKPCSFRQIKGKNKRVAFPQAHKRICVPFISSRKKKNVLKCS